ncbi:MAG: serine dehydratase subunit alpha family protein [Rikenellaceae bacterium]|nr:serine dehydratase subunit alpha family protein [Rikenellaceae bacterium]
MTAQEHDKIIDLIKREVVLSIGCTEPMAVSLCVAKACETLGTTPEYISVALSANIFKNAMGVGIPNSGMTGLPIAVALGAVAGRSEYGLEVLRDVDSAAVERAKTFLEEVKPSIFVTDESDDILFIKVYVKAGNDSAEVIISGTHTNFSSIRRNGKEVAANEATKSEITTEEDLELSLRKVYDFAEEVPLEKIEFIGEAAEKNIAAAELSFTGDYGHGLGAMLHSGVAKSIFGDTLFTNILAHTSGACDARMSGAMVPVMSNSGSGNQGISATVPVAIFANANKVSHEKMLRALVLSHLTVIYIKQSLGRLSALCGCVVAATGSACGITRLMGGGYEEVSGAVKNMVANLTGMICDGAKPSCSLKVTSGVATAVLSATLAMNHRVTTSLEGIIEDNVDNCIRNLTEIGRSGMSETDRLILEIMTSKK